MQSKMFAAFRRGDRQLAWLVEAVSDVDALTFLEHVEPLLGHLDARKFAVVEIDVIPMSIPILFEKVYSGEAIALTPCRAGPGIRNQDVKVN
jgi:hypothetical protein